MTTTSDTLTRAEAVAELLVLNAEAARCTNHDLRWTQAHAEMDVLLGILIDTLIPTT